MSDRDRPMIENSDRGITLNKALAWTMAVGLISAGLTVGVNLAGLQSAVTLQAEQSAIAANERKDLDGRLRVVENSDAKRGVEFAYLRDTIEEMKRVQKETNDLLRGLLRGDAGGSVP